MESSGSSRDRRTCGKRPRNQRSNCRTETKRTICAVAALPSGTPTSSNNCRRRPCNQRGTRRAHPNVGRTAARSSARKRRTIRHRCGVQRHGPVRGCCPAPAFSPARPVPTMSFFRWRHGSKSKYSLSAWQQRRRAAATPRQHAGRVSMRAALSTGTRRQGGEHASGDSLLSAAWRPRIGPLAPPALEALLSKKKSSARGGWRGLSSSAGGRRAPSRPLRHRPGAWAAAPGSR